MWDKFLYYARCYRDYFSAYFSGSVDSIQKAKQYTAREQHTKDQPNDDYNRQAGMDTPENNASISH